MVISWFRKRKKRQVRVPGQGPAQGAAVDLGKLQRGVVYTFEHKRKGKFSGEFLDYSGGLVRVRINTSIGSGNEWLAHAKIIRADGQKLQPDWSEKLIRSELIKSVHKRLN